MGAPGRVRFSEGAGRSSLDFIRTVRFRGTPDEVEELSGPEALAAWIGHFGPVVDNPAAPLSSRDVTAARALREAIARLIAAARDGTGLAARSVADRSRINAAAAKPVPEPALDAAGCVRWQAADPLAATLALVARDAIELVASGAARRVRRCANPACGALFLDASRPGTRRWCSMSTCGNQAKKRALRAKVAPRG